MPSWRWIAVVLVAGCAAVRSYDFELSGTLNEAAVGDLDGAIKRLQANNPRADKDLLYYFELGMLERLRYRYDESQKAWPAAQQRIESPERKSGGELGRNASRHVVTGNRRPAR